MARVAPGAWYTLLATAVLCGAGCADRTGVLVEVTRDDTVPAELDRLSFYIGTDLIPDQRSRFADTDPEEDASIAGRDLAIAPYRLLVRPASSHEMSLMVVVLAHRDEQVVAFGALDRPAPFVTGQVTGWPVVLSGEMPAGFGISATGCLTYLDATGAPIWVGGPGDLDCDGYGDDDCDDLAPQINPGSTDVCGNGVDEDCDNEADENVDDDVDGVTTCDGDCDDRNAMVHPGAPERCDQADNDCNGQCDDGFDGDRDSFTQCGSKVLADGSCHTELIEADCNDEEEHSYPGAAETCDGADNDCDWVCDEDLALDPDQDGYTFCGSIRGSCGLKPGYVDCEPEKGDIHPGAAELCNGVDDNCDGAFLEVTPCFAPVDDDPPCSLGVRTCSEVNDGQWTTECIPAGDLTVVEPGFCASYQACDEAGNQDPFGCAVEMSERLFDCNVGFQAATGEQCSKREVRLPSDGAVECSWSVVGGAEHGAYKVGFRPAAEPEVEPTPILDGCDAVVRVEAVRLAPWTETIVILRRVSPDVAIDLVLELEPLGADSCNPPDGLQCSGLSPP